jgi:competence protein ComEC
LNKNLKLKIKNLLIFIFLVLLIIFRYFITCPIYHNGDRVRITSSVLSDPINYSTSQYLRLAGLKVYLPLVPEISYGDKIIVEGTVNNGKLENPELIKKGEKKTFLSRIRNSIISFYQKVLPEPESGLLAGIVIGARGALSSDFYDLTKSVGVAHVVVASGTNVSFVVSFLMGVLTLILPRRKAILFVVLGIILYLFMSGFEAPLIRATIMASILFLSQETGRLVSAWRVLVLTAALMLIYNPDWLVDIGFILSFISTMSLMLFEKRIRTWLAGVPEVLKEGLSTSLAAQIGVAPILFVTFGQFNILSPVVNALVLLTVPYLMILGVAGGVAGLIWPFLGKIILFLSYPLLWWFVKVVSIFS